MTGVLVHDSDLVQPFQIEASQLRGRLVRLDESLSEMLSRQPYPEPVARLLGETALIAALLASALKYNGVFTLQTKGNGAVPMMVVDVTSTGDLRGYARYLPDRLPADGAAASVPAILGHGYLAFTVDQGRHTERYQGIVPLEGETLADCVQFYFRQSEQLDAGLRVAVERRDGAWRAGGMMIQRLPARDQPYLPSDREDDWRRAMVLMQSATGGELLDPALPAHDLLYRLFHEDGVRVFAPHRLQAACRCSRERVVATLGSLPRQEIEDLAEDGLVSVQCEFCGATYTFDHAGLDAVYSR